MASSGAERRAESPKSPTPMPASVTGVQLAQGVGVQEAKGFWTEAWSSVLRRPMAVVALIWIGIVVFFAIFSPLIANGHPLVLRHLDESGQAVSVSSPLWNHLSAGDVLLIIGGVAAPLVLLLKLPVPRQTRALSLLAAGAQAGLIVVISSMVASYFGARDAPDWARALEQRSSFGVFAGIGTAAVVSLPFLFIPFLRQRGPRVAVVLIVAALAAVVVGQKWRQPLERFDYRDRVAAGRVEAVYTVIPFSPNEASTSLFLKAPGTTYAEAVSRDGQSVPLGHHRFFLGTDALGQDVLTQMLHASRLSISIGLVSTGIAVLIGVTVGALMGYFGGWVDLALFRVVEIFMAIPVLFLLIVAAGVLPQELRTTYVTMAIIGAVTWTGAARFTRAEFLKLRSQDFVQSARAVGLPLRSILFKHMLPNGVTPVLVESSFAIAAAILIESILSYLGLGPVGQPSWGKLLSNATSDVGAFVPWLAIYPGAAIFFTVLAYNIIGEALRDAIDPKLKKARV